MPTPTCNVATARGDAAAGELSSGAWVAPGARLCFAPPTPAPAGTLLTAQPAALPGAGGLKLAALEPLSTWNEELWSDSAEVARSATVWTAVAEQLETDIADMAAATSAAFAQQSGLTVDAYVHSQQELIGQLRGVARWFRAASGAMQQASGMVTDLHTAVGAALAQAQRAAFNATPSFGTPTLNPPLGGNDPVSNLVRQLAEPLRARRGDLRTSLASLAELIEQLRQAVASLGSGWAAVGQPVPVDKGDWPQSSDAAQVREWWNALPPGEQAAWITSHPELVGNTDGIDYDDRIRANKINLDLAIAQATARRDLLRVTGGTPESIAALNDQIAAWQKLSDGYVDTASDNDAAAATGSKLLVFDPVNQAYAELVGTIGPDTTSIGVLVPGTGTDMTNIDGTSARAEQFVDTSNGKLAMVTWMGGDLPDEVAFDAFDSKYARDLGPKLASFVNNMDNPRSLPVTVSGHSYGGSVVGAAEADGMVASRIMHIESAGAGPDVKSVNDYAAPGTPRYNLEAPGDFIRLAQGQQIGNIGHGADPSELQGMTRMETGWVDRDDDSKGALGGPSSHSGVFAKGSTAWWNMYNVYTGQDAVELEAGSSLGFSWGRDDFGPRIDNGFEDKDYVPRMQDVR